MVQLALPVQAGYVPPGLDRGKVVDVYAVADPAAGATGAGSGGVALVVAAAPVQAISGRTEGVLSTATTTVQVVVSVPAGQAPAVLGAIGGRPLVVVVHGSVDATGGAASVPSAAPSPVAPSPVAPSPAAPSSVFPSPSAPPAPVPSSAVPSTGAPVAPAPPAAPAPDAVAPATAPPPAVGPATSGVPATGTP
jgi:hypothetical protein